MLVSLDEATWKLTLEPEEVKSRREEIKQEILEKRRRCHRQGVQDGLYCESESSLNMKAEMSRFF